MDRSDPATICSTLRSASSSARRSSASSSTSASAVTASPSPPRCSIASRPSATSTPPRAPSPSPSPIWPSRRRSTRSSKRPRSRSVKIDRQYKRGFLTNDERYRLVVHQWEQTIKDVTGALQENLDRFNPIYHDGRLRRPRQHEPDPSARRYARPDGQIRTAAPSRFRLRQTSVKACPFWNTSSPPEAPVRA